MKSMKTYLGGRRGFLTLWLLVGSSAALAHEIPVHQGITVNAAESALTFSPAYRDFLNAVSLDYDFKTATNFLVLGSAREDDGPAQDLVGGYRPYNHFYDPLTRLGISDVPPDHHNRTLLGGRSAIGNDSFTWASTLDCPGVDYSGYAGLPFLGGNVDTRNKWSWKNAHDYEWLGLTAGHRSDRSDALNDMFRAVGQVAHLVQDLSSPQHVRNEHHLNRKLLGIWQPWLSPIEDYGEANAAKLNYQHAMLDWKNAGFKKLEDFWNRRLYDGKNPAALNADANNGPKLGMAEFSNGNFVGARHLYPEYFNAADVHYYPYPSRDHSTDYNDVKNNPNLGMDNFTLKNNVVRKGIYIKKTGDGVIVNHHTRINYLGAKGFFLAQHGETPFCTIRDPHVLADYHSILIPKAVEYSAGLFDYYFRGRVEVCVLWDAANTRYSLQIRNRTGTGQDFKGGTFQLFKDDADQNRAPVTLTTSWTGASTLANDGLLTGTFPGPESPGTKFVLVYKGTIGVDAGGAALDKVDDGIAIAASSFEITPCQITQSEFTLVGSASHAPDTTYSFGVQGAGEYLAVYVEGDYHNLLFNPCPDSWKLQGYLFSWDNGDQEISWDQYANCCGAVQGEIENCIRTSTETRGSLDFVHKGGTIQSVGALASYMFDAGTATFDLYRTALYPPMPSRVRIKSYSAASFTTCAGAAPTADPPWDGTFPNDYSSPSPVADFFLWESNVGLSINGQTLEYADCEHVGTSTGCGWRVTIVLSNGNLWLGEKGTGLSPVGVYQRESGCSPGPQTLEIESY